jgi:hypothetical protein
MVILLNINRYIGGREVGGKGGQHERVRVDVGKGRRGYEP